ncbi:nuclease [Rhodoferax aquaticus]|uniref:Nuclease n=2 Tax=Rhodoferax aquaticus TaxID=2527691 RepID=A0A515EVU5_9BURK|nr:nuclease [Rhodoferax aquaticus]
MNVLHADTITGKVVAVKDGDTIVVLVDRREVVVRVAGIDAPEKKQPFGDRSKQAMSECAFSMQAIIEWKKTDRYGRAIGKVNVDGVDCGLQIIEKGLAWHYKAYAKEQSEVDRISYALAEESARSAGIGLWVDSSPTAPWLFRHPSHQK